MRHVQWQSKEEWLEVFSWAYSSSNQLRRKACYRIMAWRSRGKLPTALDAMCWLLDAVSQDDNPPHSEDSRQREAYSVAIMRFVNVMTDPEQKAEYAISVEKLASHLGIPRWIVDLRHSIAHRSLPGIEPLRVAARFCLEWLRTHYWQEQVHQWQTADQDLRDVLGAYVERAMAVRKVKLQTGTTDRSALSALRRSVQHCVAECPLSRTVQLLVQDGGLPVTPEQLAGIDPRFSCGKLQYMLQSGKLPLPTISRHVIRFWRPLLHWLHELLPETCCKTLVDAMIREIFLCRTNSNADTWRRQWFLAGWLLALLRASDRVREKSSLLSMPCQLPVRDLVHLLLQGGESGTGVGVFCVALVTELLEHQATPDDLPLVCDIRAMAAKCSRLAYFQLLLQFGKVKLIEQCLRIISLPVHCVRCFITAK